MKLTKKQKQKIYQRVERAGAALGAYRGDEPKDDCQFRDLLADMMHWADANGYHFDTELERARANYEAEINGED